MTLLFLFLHFVLFIQSISAATITCKFTADNAISNVYLDGSDVTTSVFPVGSTSYSSSALLDWTIVKYHTFTEPPTSYTTGVMYAFKMYEYDSTASPSASGFLLKCTSSQSTGPWHNLVSAVDNRWSGFASTSSTDSSSVTMTTTTLGNAFPTGWYNPSVLATAVVGTSTSGFECNDNGCKSTTSGAAKIWVTNTGSPTSYKYAALRVFVTSQPTNSPTPRPTTKSPTLCASCATITCQFISNKDIKQVWLDGVSIDVSTLGSAGANTLKTHTFSEPALGVTYAFQIDSGDTFCQSCAGLLLKCTSSSGTGYWHNLVSSVTPSSQATPSWSGFVFANQVDFTDQWYSQYVPGTDAISSNSQASGCCSGATSIWMSTRGRWGGLKVFVGPVAPTRSPTTAAPVATSTPTVPQSCPNNWASYQGRCYYMLPLKKDQVKSNTDCNLQYTGSTLGSLNDANEIGFAMNNLGCQSASPAICWVGLYQQGSEAYTAWNWRDGVTTYYYSATQWESTPFQPDDLTSTGASGANCGGIQASKFRDYGCSEAFNGVCVFEASCPPGFKKTSRYSVVSSGNVFPGECTPCPPGQYRGASDSDSSCTDCAAGYFGSKGATTSTCTGVCPAGYYCPSGTGDFSAESSQKPIACPAGTYNPSTLQSSASACLACPAGYYCPAASTSGMALQCLAGYCGNQYATTSTCSQACVPGYYCPTGSVCPYTGQPDNVAAFKCGGDNVYCPSGRSTPITVDAGYYSIGGTSTTRTNKQLCDQGYYCSGGIRYECPVGKYGPATGLSAVSQCLSCDAGYFCDVASTSANNDHCAPSSVAENLKATYYCPASTTSRLTIPTPTHITLPTAAPTKNRISVTTCPDNKVCANGIASSKLNWNTTSSDCDKTISVNEMSASGLNVASFKADLADAILSGNVPYTVTYSVASFTYIDEITYPNCAPGTNSAKNGGNLFVINSSTGSVTLARGDLNFETCNPVVDMRYKLKVRATAVGGSTTTVIECDAIIKVEDLNDAPYFNETTVIAYRAIKEKQLKNTQADRCNSEAKTLYGCPVIESGTGNAAIDDLGPALIAIDEDYGSTLTYTLSAGSHNAVFKINSCTGVISYSGNYEVSYRSSNPKPAYSFNVIVTDDGNGGQYSTRSASIPVQIYIININDPPILPTTPSPYFQVLENSVAGTQLTPSALTVTDEDGDSFTFSISANDDNAFVISPSTGVITLSAAGASKINYESQKKSYTIGIVVTDGKPDGAASGTYKVQIINNNDPPIFDTSRLVFYVIENAPTGTMVCTTQSGVCGTTGSPATVDEVSTHGLKVSDEDVDSGIVTDKITYSLITGSPYFTINSTTGVLYANSGLDFEDESRNVGSGTGRMIQITVQATSSGQGINAFAPVPLSTQTTVTIYLVDVNEPPVIGDGSGTIKVDVIETWPESIGFDINSTLFQTTDPDNKDIWIFGAPAPMQTVTFSIGGSLPVSEAAVDGSSLFSISTDTSTGLPIIKNLKPLDYETSPNVPSICGSGKRCYKIYIVATDNGGPVRASTTASVIINIINTNDPPTFPSRGDGYIISISENPSLEVDGTATVNDNGNGLVGFDEDIANSLTFEVVGGSGIEQFGVSKLTSNGAGSTSFRVYLKQGVSLNFEEIEEYSLRVKVYDDGPSSYIGKKCQYNAAKTALIIDCGSNGGAFCSQIDSRCYEVCSATSVDSSTVVSNRPRINRFFCDYNGNAPLTKYVEYAEQTLTIQVVDANDRPFVVFNSSDPKPKSDVNCTVKGTISSQLYQLSQVAFSKIEVHDDDDLLPSNTFKGTPFTFTATNPSGEASFWNVFNMNSTTGRLSSIANVALTQGTTLQASITVTDSNSPSASSTCMLQVKIVFDNHPPELPTTITKTMSEAASANTIILSEFASDLTTIDVDIPFGDSLVFSASSATWYSVNSATGRLILLDNSQINYESLSLSTPAFSRRILVRATDSYGAEDVSTIIIQVQDVNEAPVWLTASLPSTFYVREDLTAGSSVSFSLINFVSDPDTYADLHGNPEWKTITFSMASCGSSCPFEMGDTSNGILRVKAGFVLDFEGAVKSWTLLVTATDGGSLSSSRNIVVSLQDVNEAPYFTTSTPVLNLDENDDATIGVDLIDMSAIVADPDVSDPVSSLIFNLTGEVGNLFYVQGGKLKMNGVLDYEQKQSYLLQIMVTDSQGLSSAKKDVTVNVLNKNDLSISSIAVVGSPDGIISCDGAVSNNLIINGKNFGFKDHATNALHQNPTIELTYWYSTTNANDVSPIYTATNCAVDAGDNQVLRCRTVAGVGKNLGFKLRIAVTSTSLSFATTFFTYQSALRFELPEITAVSKSAFLTVGGESFTITGRCLGRLSDGLVLNHGTSGAVPTNRDSYVTYCSTKACYAPSCVTSGSTGSTLSCTTIAGLGKSFIWTVKIAAQSGLTLSFGSYAKPVLQIVPLSSARVLPTTGVFPVNAPLVIRGTNFGDTNEVPDVAKLLYYYTDSITLASSVDETQLIGCKVTSAAGLRNEITCTGSEPGIGYGLDVIIGFSGLQNDEDQTLVNFTAPVVTTLEGDALNDANTIGGQLVTIVGDNFGPVCGVPASDSGFGGSEGLPCGEIVVSYSRGSKKASNPAIDIVYYPNCAVISQNRISCEIVPGTGSGHVWKVWVGGQEASYASNIPTTSYSRPTIGSYAGPGSHHANTTGGQQILLEGSNFGPLDGAYIEAYYGSDLYPTEFYTDDCSVSVAHQEIVCLTAPGVGEALAWTVYVDGQLSRSELTNYAAPAITGLMIGNAKTTLSPDGGDIVYISGTNFGPTIANSPASAVYLESVTFGTANEPNAYSGKNCVVLSHSLIQCTTPAGIGSSLSWRVKVKGQLSPASPISLSFDVLNVTSLSPLTGTSRGGYVATLVGSGLAICDSKASIKINFGGVNVLTNGNYYNGNGVKVTSCPVLSTTRMVEFAVPERTGPSSVSVSITMETTAHSSIVQSVSGAFTFVYDPPYINKVYAEPGGSLGAVAVTIIGTNFCASETCCSTYYDGIKWTVSSHSHERIKLYVPRAGSVYIKCADGQTSNSKEFEASSPYITGTNPQLNSLEFPTRGGDLVEVWGLYLGISPEYHIGPFNATLISHGEVSCDDASRPATSKELTLDASVVCYKSVISIPPGGGKNLELYVKTLDQESLADDSRFEFLSYKSPVITNVIGAGNTKKFDTTGVSKAASLPQLTNAITIQGTNFYVKGLIYIGSLTSGITCDPYTWDHESIVCFVSEGEGFNLPWIVSVEGTTSNTFGSTTTSLYFNPPSNVAITSLDPIPYGYSTEGGDVLTLSGLNFGRSMKQTIYINGKTCSLISSTHTSIACLAPEGEGASLPINVTVAGQSVISSMKFSYGKPVITLVSPSSGTTRAIDPNTNQPITLTITGRNFGVDQIKLFMATSILLGERDSTKDSDLITKKFILATHRELRVNLPEYFGSKLPLSVIVKGQRFDGSASNPNTTFTYLAPDVENIAYTIGSGVVVVAQTGISSAPPPNAGFGSSSGRRLLNNGYQGRNLASSNPYGSWSSNGFGVCKGDYRIKNVFWKDSLEITPEGGFSKTTIHYSTSDCVTDSKLFTVVMTGTLADLGINPAMTCGQSFESLSTSVVLTPHTEAAVALLNTMCLCTSGKPQFAVGTASDLANCLASSKVAAAATATTSLTGNSTNVCQILSIPHHIGSKYGLYVIVEDHELYISQLFESLPDLNAAEAFGLSDIPSAYSSSTPTLIGPVFPTDGCYLWEENSEYNRRKREAFLNIGNTEIPRLCLDKALLYLNGDNFGVNLLSQPGILRVTFVNPLTGEEFEASTTSSEGNHKQLCSTSSGCLHSHTSVRVWVPYGSGRGLQVRLQVGNQVSYANFTVNYLPPHIDAMFPGTIFRKAAFQDADGQRVVMQGTNFGWIGSSANVLINGRKCSDAQWFAGSDGEPYVECLAARDTVGPKSIMTCVANQTYVSKIFKTDAALLAAGEAAGVWVDGETAAQSDSSGYASRIFSYTVTRCGAKKYGRLYELCSDCPNGADCGIGSFKTPQSSAGYFGYEINKTADATRAQERCGAGTFTNETSLSKFPDAIVRETCLDFVKCEPEESCVGGNKCATGYQYAELACLKIRDSVDAGTTYVSNQGDVITSNACRVQLNPYTGEYEGVHSDCRGNLTLGAACDHRRPWECSVCNLVYSGADSNVNGTISEIPTGVCSCVPSNRCSLCTINTHYRLNNACIKCPENVALLISLFVIAAIAACGAAYYLSKRKVNLAFLAICVDYCQVLSMFASTRIVWPAGIKRLLELLTLINFNIDIAAPECILPSFEYEVKFYATELLPLAALGVLLIIHVSYTLYKVYRDRRHVKVSSHTSKLISVFMIIMYFLYLTVTKRALDIFNCNPTIPSDGYSYTEFTSLKCNGGGLCRCGEPGGVQQGLVPAAYIFLFLYSAGFPLFVFVLVYMNKTLVMEDQYLRAYGIGDTRETNPDAYDFRKKYHLLYMYYKPRMSFWLLAVLFRKFMIAMSSLMFRGNPTFQMTVVLLVLFWAFVMQARYRPFLSTGERGVVIKELEARAALAINDPMHFQLDYELLKKVTTAVRVGNEISKREKDGKKNKQVGKLWENEDVTRKRAKKNRIAHTAQAYFFDFNTVELILIGCSIFICLCGIMFQSGRYEGRKDLEEERDSIVYLMVIVVAVSFFYMAMVAAAEAAPWIYTLYLSRFMKRNDALIEKELDQGVVISENPLLNARVIGAANAEDLTHALESNMNALNRTRQQNQELLTDLNKLKGPS